MLLFWHTGMIKCLLLSVSCLITVKTLSLLSLIEYICAIISYITHTIAKYSTLLHFSEHSLLLKEKKNYQIIQECSLIIYMLDEHSNFIRTFHFLTINPQTTDKIIINISLNNNKWNLLKEHKFTSIISLITPPALPHFQTT